jgi:D-alanyl-lipoteichoic acid acyltransferase DltB (MBOAT superfamily)
MYVGAAYGDVRAHAGLPLLLATYAFAAQIYYDFSGYTDMALGTARLFGVRLTQNFAAPYGAGSIAEFWRRWHISLSRWLLDYVFKPLQVALRGGKTAGTVVALLATFLACGLWHGAAPPFVAWGLLHGTFMAFGFSTARWRGRVGGAIAEKAPSLGAVARRHAGAWRVAATFNLVCFAWIFFRASSLRDAAYVCTHLFSGAAPVRAFLLSFGARHLALTFASLALAVAAASRDRDAIASESFRTLRPVARWAAYYALAGAVLWSLVFRYSEPFIYSRF